MRTLYIKRIRARHVSMLTMPIPKRIIQLADFLSSVDALASEIASMLLQRAQRDASTTRTLRKRNQGYDEEYAEILQETSEEQTEIEDQAITYFEGYEEYEDNFDEEYEEYEDDSPIDQEESNPYYYNPFPEGMVFTKETEELVAKWITHIEDLLVELDGQEDPEKIEQAVDEAYEQAQKEIIEQLERDNYPWTYQNGEWVEERSIHARKISRELTELPMFTGYKAYFMIKMTFSLLSMWKQLVMYIQIASILQKNIGILKSKYRDVLNRHIEKIKQLGQRIKDELFNRSFPGNGNKIDISDLDWYKQMQLKKARIAAIRRKSWWLDY